LKVSPRSKLLSATRSTAGAGASGPSRSISLRSGVEYHRHVGPPQPQLALAASRAAGAFRERLDPPGRVSHSPTRCGWSTRGSARGVCGQASVAECLWAVDQGHGETLSYHMHGEHFAKCSCAVYQGHGEKLSYHRHEDRVCVWLSVSAQSTRGTEKSCRTICPRSVCVRVCVAKFFCAVYQGHVSIYFLEYQGHEDFASGVLLC